MLQFEDRKSDSDKYICNEKTKLCFEKNKFYLNLLLISSTKDKTNIYNFLQTLFNTILKKGLNLLFKAIVEGEHMQTIDNKRSVKNERH